METILQCNLLKKGCYSTQSKFKDIKIPQIAKT